MRLEQGDEHISPKKAPFMMILIDQTLLIDFDAREREQEGSGMLISAVSPCKKNRGMTLSRALSKMDSGSIR